MRKILAFICCLMVMVCFAACGETQEAATETTTDSFNALAFDTRIYSQLVMSSAEIDLMFAEMRRGIDGFAISDAATAAGNNIQTYNDAIAALSYPEDNSDAKRYQAAAGIYTGNLGIYTTYIGLLGLDMAGYGLDNPDMTADIAPDTLSNMQELLDNEGNLDDISDSLTQLILTRRTFLLHCGEFADDAAVDEYLAEYPFPIED